METTVQLGDPIAVKLGFICVICGGNQILPDNSYKVTFPICEECLKNLREIIMEKHNARV